MRNMIVMVATGIWCVACADPAQQAGFAPTADTVVWGSKEVDRCSLSAHPATFKVNPQREGVVQFSWTLPADGSVPDGYQIEVIEDKEAAWATYVEVDGVFLSKEMSAGSYFARIRSRYCGRFSQTWSEAVRFTVDGGAPGVVEQPNAPAHPPASCSNTVVWGSCGPSND